MRQRRQGTRAGSSGARHRAIPWVWLLASLALVLVACGSSDGPAEASGEPAAVASPEPDAMVSFDGKRCTSTIPRSWSALPRIIRIEMDETMAFAVGVYKPSFDHRDLVTYAATATTTQHPPFLEVHRVFGGQGVSDRTLDLVPGRYFAVCLQEPKTVVVLPDLVIEA